MIPNQVMDVVAILVPAIGALAWLMSVHGRVSSHDRELQDIKADVRYIRARIDRAISDTGKEPS